jgi:hypothetical protein
MTDAILFLTIFGLVLWILLIRLIGAWMLRITDLIKNQEKQIENQALIHEHLFDTLNEHQANQEIMIGVLRRIADKL